MAIIGNFIYDAKADTYAGSISTLTLQRNDIRLISVKKSAKKEPDYRIVTETAFGSVEFGAAWKRRSENGRDFLSLSIDDPALATALNAALFPSDNGETAALVWSRPKRKAKAE